MTATLARRDVSGHYAGPVSRLVALVGDITGSAFIFGLVGLIALYLVNVVTPAEVTSSSGSWVHLIVLAGWELLWFWLPVAWFGRTPAMAVVGLAVVRRDGSDVLSGAALARALVLPLSMMFAIAAAIGLFIGRERRALHDVISDTVVVYDWGSRQAEQPITIRDRFAARVRHSDAGNRSRDDHARERGRDPEGDATAWP